MRQAVMYGAGNIGRGFIGALFSQSGYKVTFIDAADGIVAALREKGEYPVRYVSNEGSEETLIRNVTALHALQEDEVADAIAGCDILSTAVGVRALPLIIPNIAAGLRRRWNAGGAPLNIIICENLMNADRVVERLIKERLTESEQVLFDQTVGLVEASIGRMVPQQTEEMKNGNPLRVCVERYAYLPVDRAAFKGAPAEVQHMIPVSPFDFYIKRKLFIHNMSHAVCAYLGDIAGLSYIYEAVDTADIRLITQNAMEESALALCRRYDVSLLDLQMHIEDLLHRFGNAALRDTCRRVGADPARKLGPSDRLIGAASLALEEGVRPAYIAAGAAAAVRRYLAEAGAEQNMSNAQNVLRDTAGLRGDAPLTLLILPFYEMLLRGASPADLRRAADEEKAKSLGNIM